MKRHPSLKRRMQMLSALQDAVGAMRTLAAHHFRRARGALVAGREYRRHIDQIVAEVGIHQPRHDTAPAGLLVVGSDLGLCGDYNGRVAQFAVEHARQNASGRIYVTGRRVRSRLAQAGLEPTRRYDTPASLEGMTRLLLTLAQDLLDDYLAARIGRLDVVAARFEGVGHFRPVATGVLPIEPVEAAIPLRRSPYVDPAQLSAVVVREFLYITLSEILLDALAAEHGMRLMAGETALQWLEESVGRTRRQLATSKSETTTQEMLDNLGALRLRRGAES